MNTKKIVSIVVPTHNEEDNVSLICARINQVFVEQLSSYDYKILFIDNKSEDNTRRVIEEIAAHDAHVQYIFNISNFGFSRSTFYGLTQSEGDCTVLLFADMQDPPELIVDFVKEWEAGNKVVIGIKNKSRENWFMYHVRKMYYWLMQHISEVRHIEQFTGFGLYDKSVIKIFRGLDDPLPYLRGIVAEFYPDCQRVTYTQETRKYGKTNFNFLKLYNLAMLGITSYSKVLMRISTFVGGIIAAISFFIAVVTFLLKVLHVVDYPVGVAATLFGVFFLGGVQLVFIGILGEYILGINTRTIRRPIVIEEERHGLKAIP